MSAPRLRILDTPDIGGAALSAFAPDDPTRFSILVYAEVAFDTDDFSVLISFKVCSPTWLAERSTEKGFRWGRHYLFLDRWDYRVLWRAIDDLCRRIDATDWHTAGPLLAQFGMVDGSD